MIYLLHSSSAFTRVSYYFMILSGGRNFDYIRKTRVVCLCAQEPSMCPRIRTDLNGINIATPVRGCTNV